MSSSSQSPAQSASTLQRSPASIRQRLQQPYVPAQCPGESSRAGSAMQDVQRGRPLSQSPEKENRPLAFPEASTSPSKRGESKEERKMSAEAAESASVSRQPQLVSGGKVATQKTRSMSPSKRFKGKLKGGDDEDILLQRSPQEVAADFLEMLNDMQVPSSMVHKLIILSPRVKEAMLRGRDTLTLTLLSAAAGQDSFSTTSTSLGKGRPALAGILRRQKSSCDLTQPGTNSNMGELREPKSRSSIFGGASRTPSAESGSGRDEAPPSPSKFYSASNASAASLFRPRSRAASFSSVRSTASNGRGTDTLAVATEYATMLKANDSSRLDVTRVKRMRAVLSSESPIWLTAFFDEGGYTALLARLKELLDMEWREEQHDDNLLHELLRCFVALASTDCGRAALASSLPSPFCELASLLYSEKRPGDLSTRKLLVDLLCVLAELPGPSCAASAMQRTCAEHEVSTVLEHVDKARSCPPHMALLVVLLHNMRDPNKDAMVDFISASHTPRPFKSLVTELLNVNRDYFWVFCHGSNRYWALRDINIADVEGPKVPGGMTGGVEFEAMAYQTSLMRLINLIASRIGRIAQAEGPQHLAHNLHQYLFASGLQRALAITRKASQVYYQPLHLELSRYFDYARRAKYRLPAELEMYQNTPPVLSIAAHYATSTTQGGKAIQTHSNAPGSDAGLQASTSFLPMPSVTPSLDLPPTASLGPPLAASNVNNDGVPFKKRSREASHPDDGALQVPVSRLVPSKEMRDIAAESSPKKRSDGTPASMVGNAVQQWEKLSTTPSWTALPASPSKRS